MKTKTIALLLAVALVFGGVIGGTIAWLTDITGPVTNTFTTAGIDITLTETFNTDTDGKDGADAWTAQLVPGKEYAKDPVVSVNGDVTDVDIYLFFKVETSGAVEHLDYALNTEGWTALGDAYPGVYYRVVTAAQADSDPSWNLLVDNKVTVDDELTDEAMAAADFVAPKLTFTAYAIQTEGFTTAAAAWAEIGD